MENAGFLGITKEGWKRVGVEAAAVVVAPIDVYRGSRDLFFDERHMCVRTASLVRFLVRHVFGRIDGFADPDIEFCDVLLSHQQVVLMLDRTS